jgi:hypothetical protein
MKQLDQTRGGILVASALTVSVLIYVGPVRGMDMSDASFLVCAALLVLALIALHVKVDVDDIFGFRIDVEAFAQEAESMYNEVLKPRMDRLVNTVGGQTGSQEYAESPGKSVVTVDGSQIATDLPGKSPKEHLKLAFEFKRISFLLCQCMQSFPQESRAMFKALGVPPPTFEKTEDEKELRKKAKE